ncbi:MAG: hypothetical protein DCC56_05445 [Anaerolineae bacterium]|nr:MAG: hypothetical protein DCC56_05445 [Anaerolineae bacterium]WKZ43701.1 MAG: hypothetical protein QY302_16530 [Anaerolineales bacterium]
MTTRTEKRLVQEIWDDMCDKILKELTHQYHWDASYYVAMAVAEYLPPEKLEKFKKACEKKNTHIWYNVLGSFAQERIEELRIEIRKPIVKKCRHCGEEFLESSIRSSVSIKAKYDRIFCNHCTDSVLSGGLNVIAKQSAKPPSEMLTILREFCEVVKFVPSSSFMAQPSFFSLPEEEQVKATRIFLEMPLYKFYVSEFGSWFKALIQAGVLDDGTQRLFFGTRCLANDGHECASIAEKTIDDWLADHNIMHQKEPLYPYDEELNPATKLRADWRIESILIEYAGLMNRQEYSEKMSKKKVLADKHGIELIILSAEDLLGLDKILGHLI